MSCSIEDSFFYLFISSTKWVNNRYKRNGLLQMLKRNVSVKEAPQRWQDNAADGAFDVVFTFEERVFDMVIEGLLILYCLLHDSSKLTLQFTIVVGF